MFNVTDHWYRFEWQQRGSSHIHGFLWLTDAPKPSVVTAEFRDALAQYWGVLRARESNDFFDPRTNPAIIPLLSLSISRRIP